MKNKILHSMLATLFCLLSFASFAQSYLVSGAGTSAANGTYTLVATTQSGAAPGSSQYSNGPFIIYLSNSPRYWNIRIADNSTGIAYYNTDGSSLTTPPSTGWQKLSSGANPVPTVDAVLSIELKAFTATYENNQSILTWQTANEVNNKGFDIQRKQEQDWQTLGFVEAKGKAADYSFEDKAPLSMNYYRLRQLDNDGKVSFSKVVSVAIKGSKTLKVYPTLVNNTLNIETDSPNDYAVFNLLGQSVLRGKTAQRLDVSALSQGTYILKVGTEQVKFQKL